MVSPSILHKISDGVDNLRRDYDKDKVRFVAINMVFGNIVEPRLMGYGVGVSPLIVFIGLFFWGWVFGPVGMLLSVPLTMTLKLALESDKRTRWIAILIGSERDAEYALAHRRNSAPGESGGG